MTIFTSPHGSLPLPRDRTVWDELETHARNTPHAPMLICGATDRVLTYQQVYDRALLVAAGLHHDGLRKGDVVVMLTLNCIEYPVVFFALNRLQVVCSPTFPQFTPREVAGQLIRTKAKRLIAHPSFTELALQGASKAGLPEGHVLSIGEAVSGEYTSLRRVQDYIDNARPLPALPRIDPDAVVAMPFSSGTASRPKGVQLTARALYAAAAQTAAREERHPVILGVLPFYHIYPTNLLHITTLLGLTMLVLPTFEPEMFLRSIAKYKVEKLSLAPPMVSFLAYHPLVDKYDLSSTKYVVSAGGPQNKDAALKLRERLGVEVQQGYGMTEFGGGVTVMENGNVRLGSVGRLLPNVEMKVKSLENDQDLGVNRKGELLFRSPQLMKGYLGNATATSATLTSDGFLRTGDLGYIDDDGFVFIVDRIKSLIKYKGHQVSASELEDILQQHPLVAEACVVRGRDFSTGEEIPKAYIVATPNAPKRLTRQEITLFVASKVAPFKRIRDVQFVDAIPKNPAGKAHRRQLQAREDAAQNAAPPPSSMSRI